MAKTTPKGKKGPAKGKPNSTAKQSSADAAIEKNLNRRRAGYPRVAVGKENDSHPEGNVQPSSSGGESDCSGSIDSRVGIQFTDNNDSDNSDIREGKWIVDTLSCFSP